MVSNSTKYDILFFADFKQWFFADQTIIWSYAVYVKMDANKLKMTTKVLCWCDEINAVSIVLHTITLVMSSCKESVIIYVKTIRNDIRKHESITLYRWDFLEFGKCNITIHFESILCFQNSNNKISYLRYSSSSVSCFPRSYKRLLPLIFKLRHSHLQNNLCLQNNSFVAIQTTKPIYLSFYWDGKAA